MLRRSFRVGLLVGVLGGLAFALVKALQSRRESSALAPPPSPEWPPMRDTAPPAPAPTPPTAPPATPAEPPPTPAPPATEEPVDAGPTTVVAEPVEAPPDEPHGEEPDADEAASVMESDDAPQPAKRAAKAAKATRKAAKKSARKAARKAAPASPAAPGADRAWVEPSGGVCPPSHPVKAKLVSKIFHVPGQLNYERTTPDRCYRDADAATGDGLRQSKR